jgi:hypothetical protein
MKDKDKNIIKISPKLQIEIFEMAFLYMIEKPSLRWRLKSMIDSRDRVDEAELDLKLRKLELEIIKQKGE